MRAASASTPVCRKTPGLCEQPQGSLIAGASSGIGEATARLLAANGARVVMGARRTDRLHKIPAEIREQGGIAGYRSLDVTNRDDVKSFVGFARERFGASMSSSTMPA